MIKRILIGVSGTPASQAKMAYALDLAQRHGAELTLMSVIDVDRLARVGPVPLGGAHYAARLRDVRVEESRDRALAAIADFEAAASAAGVAVHAIAREGDPFDLLTDAWRYQDLCLLGLRGWFNYGVVPEPENALLNLIVRGVRPILGIAEVARPVRKVLIAYDGSMGAARAMKRFIRTRLWPDVAVHIACFDKDEAEARPLLEDAAGYCRAHGHAPTVARVEAPPKTGILAHAIAEDADLIVLGGTYQQRLFARMFSDIALHVIRNADRPVFITH
jgi:nucleotide-binding universal stress UspA family protein